MTERPRADPAPADVPFWAGVRAGELRVQRCASCDEPRFPPGPRCRVCRSAGSRWTRCAGTGEIWSFTVCHPPVLAAFAAEVPYNVIVVRLDEGPFIVANLRDHNAGDLAVGRRVEFVPFAVAADHAIVAFRPTT